MGHFGAMNDLRDIGGSTSGTSGIYAEDLNRSIPQIAHLSHGSSQAPHFGSAPPSTTPSMLSMPSSQGPSDISDRINDSEKHTIDRDKDSIYK